MEPRVKPKRVVSLIASATEIIAALGCRDRLIARSHECDYPADVLNLPALTEAKFKVEGSSGDIDRKVRAIVAEGLSVYRVDAERLRDLAPDLIVTQDHCEVCAVSLSDVEAATCDWAGKDTRIVSLRPDSLDDVYSDIARVAEALNVAAGGTALIAAMQRRLAELSARAKLLPAPRVAFVEWSDPLMSGGNWMPTLIETAGGRNLFGKAGGRSEVLGWDDFKTADPEVIILAPCGYDLEASRRDLINLSQRPGWNEIRAVCEGRVYCGDGNAYFNRPGPRLVETAEIIAEILHPGRLDFGHGSHGAWARHPAEASASAGP
jgi:iron complex transport system substrate-binding protein